MAGYLWNKETDGGEVSRAILERAARERLAVHYKYRNSTESASGSGYIQSIQTQYDRRGQAHEVVSVIDQSDRCVMNVRRSDIVAIEAARPREVVERVESEPIEYRSLGRIGGSDQFTVEALRGARRVGLYRGYLRERDDGMVLYIKEPYEAGLPGKVNIAIAAMK